MGFLICAITFVALAAVILKVYLKLNTRWCRSNVCLLGKTVIVTGANTGVGYEAAEDFAKRGARVILACRNETRGKNAEEKIKAATNNPNIFFKKLDLVSMKSVRQFADEIIKSEERIDILLNNAGVGASEGPLTEDGFLPINATNYFGPFLLTNLLLDIIVKTPNSRIVNVSSIAAKFLNWYGPLDVNKLNEYPHSKSEKDLAYPRTKACNILFTIELAKKLEGTGTTTYSLHPGYVSTDIFDTLTPTNRILFGTILNPCAKTPVEGAQTSIYCSVQKGIESLSGEHFHDCRYCVRYKSVEDPDLPKKLWDVTTALVKLEKK